MTATYARKALRALITLWLSVTFVFIILRVSGDPVRTILPDDAPPEMIEQYTRDWGLDRPIWEQYVRYFAAIAEGRLGRSFLDGRDAVEVVFEHIPKTLQLMGMGFLVMVALGIPLGVIAALRRNSWVDRAIMTAAVSGYSIPNFFLGILLILVFAVQLRLLPSGGSDSFLNILLPAVTLGTSGAGVLARFARSSMLEILNQPYIRAAEAKGLPWGRVVRGDAMPNAAIPTVTVMGFIIGGLLGGALVTETVFAWPGMGRLLVNSVATRDLAVVQVIMLVTAFSMVTVNMLVDVVYGLIDPRVRDVQEGLS